jgi:uncharacterized protein (TIGR03086 family)
MDDLGSFLTAQRAFTDRVHAVTADQWQLGTPNTEWTVADLLGHLIEEHRYAAPLLHGQDLDTAAQIVEGTRSLPVDGGVGADLAEEWDEAAVLSADAFAADGALDRTVELSRGTTAVRDYIHEMTFDLVVHGWDLATAIGYSGDPFPDELVEDVYEAAKTFGDLSSSGFFSPPVDVPDDAPTLDKLIGLTGRRPR